MEGIESRSNVTHPYSCATIMASPAVFDVDPRTLRLPPSRPTGADPVKLQRQIARHGKTTTGMPNVLVYRCTDGELMIYDGVTRATRVAKLLPGTTVTVEVCGDLNKPGANQPTVEDQLP